MDPQPNFHVEPSAMDSSPRSNQLETYHDHDSDHLLPPKLRLMCSYGGHIMPRPHDKVLSYVGGETRLVVVDRNSSLSSFSSRLSRTLLNGRPFTLKYQLPSEDLDSLVSVTTDEDLHNMVEEYDRITPAPTLSAASNSSNATTSLRIRLFIFFTKIETAATMGSLLDDAKSETWFVDALNGSGLIPRGLSDSVTVNNCLVNLDMDPHADSGDIEHDEKVKVENGSSIGSSTSSPSMSNLPPIKVRVEDQQQVKVEEQFSRMNFIVEKQEDGSGVQLPTTMANKLVRAALKENVNRIMSDDERSDQGNVVVGFRKPPLPLHPLQIKPSAASVATNSTYSLASPDSVASDSSISSANSFSKPMYYQDQVQVPSRAPTSPNTNTDNNYNINTNTNTNTNPSNTHIQIQKVQESGYILPPQMDQQQLPSHQQMSMHYIPHPAAGGATLGHMTNVSPYYHTYPLQQQEQQQQQHQNHYQHLYAMPQPSYMAMQSESAENSGLVSAPPTITTPPIYPTKVVSKPVEVMGGGVYRTITPPQYVQVSHNQLQPQYFAQMAPHPSHSVSVNAPPNYGYDQYQNPTHEHQVYYTQHQPPPMLPSQYQTMTTTAAVAALADATKQLSADATV